MEGKDVIGTAQTGTGQTLAMLTEKNPVIATILGSMAAACECEVDGNIPVTLHNVHAKIDAVERQLSFE